MNQVEAENTIEGSNSTQKKRQNKISLEQLKRKIQKKEGQFSVEAQEFVPKSVQKRNYRSKKTQPKHNQQNENQPNQAKNNERFITASDKQAAYLQSSENPNSEELFSRNHVQQGIDFDQYENIPVKVSGDDIPKPLVNFESSKLHKNLKENIKRAKYLKPTPIQKHAVSIGLAKRDLMAAAQTGSGKTAAFLFPIISHLMLTKAEAKRNVKCSLPKVLILAPTRELASQIFDEALRFCFSSKVYCVVVYGGAGINPQIELLRRRNCDICVATPGRLIDLLERGLINFKDLKYFILDEADRMLDMGFEPQLRKICQSDNFPTKTKRTTFMFSATFPKEIQGLAKDFLNNYVFVTVGVVGGAAKNVTQNFIEVTDDYPSKRAALIKVIKDSNAESVKGNRPPGLKLVFMKTKRKCDRLAKDLFKNHGIKCTTIHGNRSQVQREKALNLFACKKVEILIATDVASRGLDIPQVEHVINFDMPREEDSYVHRIGRTGRAGNKGSATALITTTDIKVLRLLLPILKEADQKIPEWLNGLSKMKPQKVKKPEKFSRDIRQLPKANAQRRSSTARQSGFGNQGRSSRQVQGSQNKRNNRSRYNQEKE